MSEDNEFERERLRELLEEGERSGFVEYSYNSLMDELDSETQ